MNSDPSRRTYLHVLIFSLAGHIALQDIASAMAALQAVGLVEAAGLVDRHGTPQATDLLQQTQEPQTKGVANLKRKLQREEIAVTLTLLAVKKCFIAATGQG